VAYRGQPSHAYRDTIADTKTAVRYLRCVSGEYGIGPDRIAAMDRSAGAALAILLAADHIREAGKHAGPPYTEERLITFFKDV